MKNSRFTFRGRFNDTAESFKHDKAQYATRHQPSVGETISMIQLKQFQNGHKCWLMSINFGFQVNLWEINFNATIPAKNLDDGGNNERISIKRLWFDIIDNDNWQPFCITELRNQPAAVGNIALGCGSGTLMFYQLVGIPNPIALVGNISVQETERLLADSTTLKRRISVKSDEPITHIYECQGHTQHGKILFCTLNGIVYLLNNILKKVVLKLNISAHNHRPPDLLSVDPKIAAPSNNCVYYMGPYSRFDMDVNPILVVHD